VANGEAMRIILSRKGFDHSFGGKPSPIFPDGRMVSLPIPARMSPIRYREIRWQEYNLGSLAADLTNGRISESFFAHLDPDLREESLPRSPGWRPIFGQAGAAQGHLQKNNVQAGDLFLFFGLFRQVIQADGRLAWDKGAPQRHVLWGWLQIGQAVRVAECNPSEYEWARYHPHFHGVRTANNTVYFARQSLSLPGVAAGTVPGAGVFPFFSERLALTPATATRLTEWELPLWFYPRDGMRALTYHSDVTRWHRTESCAGLRAVARGQEFVLDMGDSPEAVAWLMTLLACA